MENEANSPSSIRMENREWLAENIKGLDQAVNEMQLLVENHGKFSVENLRDDQLLQPELIARVKEISHRHHLLAHHYNETMNYKISSRLNHPFLTPDKKLGMQNVDAQVVGSDSSLSSGGGISDTTPVEGSESSLMSSDSDSESYNSSPTGKMLKHEFVSLGTEVSETGGMVMKLSDCEKELKVSKEKLFSAEGEIANLKSELLKTEALIAKMGSMEAQLVSAETQIKLQEADMDKETKKSLMLQRQIVGLETELESEKRLVEELRESVKNYTANLSDRDHVIEKLNAELQDASGCFALEKWQLESSVSNLSKRLAFHEGRANELQKQRESLEAERTEIIEMHEALQKSLQNNLESVNIELTKKNSVVDTLSKNLDELKLNYDTLMVEKDGVDAKLQTLNTDLSVRDDQIQRLDCILLELKSKAEHLRAEADSANKLISELKSRILELEKEMEMQAVTISDTAEGKREAIRQLCFSVDHFRSAYQELREEYAIRKRPAAMAS
ncbi:protein NETWORKED 4A-like [Salvia miltiorrhiza]|uniref:protein NETWORKED 4A-like n=1 Tax=Salvia miltiorrhiza TaxID=226208 RepID=UPI0025AD7423|nr:protein NETWORKED 4A-like [Salvia miltiorrhiza]XP_057776762.1 protein NETWORKED 4A-like [Salvia miltiorrhiza]XP_057776763.1 protein NETWORKED 4A-like [Salvia miltiorrhiza]